MRTSRFLILLLLMSFIGGLGCTPPTTTLVGVNSTDAESGDLPVNYSNIEMGDSVSMWMTEGEIMPLPIDVSNISATDMETVTATIESDLPGFSVTNGAEFPLTSGSNHVVVVEFDGSDMEVEIGQPQTRYAVVVITTDQGEVHKLFILIEVIDERDYTENQLNLWTTTVHMDAEAGGAAVVKAYTVSSNWNEDVSYTATVTGAGCTVIYNGSGTMTAGSSNQIWTQYMPPTTMADPAHETEQYMCLLTISAADMVHEVTFLIDVTDPNYGAGDDDDSAF